MSENVDDNSDNKLDTLPDIKRCKAKEIIASDYELADCLVDRAFCKHALSFGYHLLCRHPQRAKIIKNGRCDE